MASPINGRNRMAWRNLYLDPGVEELVQQSVAYLNGEDGGYDDIIDYP